MALNEINICSYFYGLILSGAPWILGASLAVAVTRNSAPNLSSYSLPAGIGGYFGYLLCVFFTWFLGKHIQPWWPGLVVAVTCVVTGFLGYSALRPQRHLSRSHKAKDSYFQSSNSALYALTFVPLLILLGWATLYHVANIPVQSWDVLSLWAPVSLDFLASASEPQQSVFYFENRHPPTAALLASWTPLMAQFGNVPNFSYVPWVFLWVSVGLVIYGFARLFDQSRVFALATSWASMTIPLTEMHAVGPGYTEMLVLMSLVSSTAVIALALERPNRLLMCIGLMLAASVIVTNNKGLGYFVVIILPLLIV